VDRGHDHYPNTDSREAEVGKRHSLLDLRGLVLLGRETAWKEGGAPSPGKEDRMRRQVNTIKTVQIRISENLRKALKLEAARRNLTIGQVLIDLLGVEDNGRYITLPRRKHLD